MKQPQTIQYVTTVSVNKTQISKRTHYGKLSISDFKAIAVDARKRDDKAHITCERHVDGVSDGEGDIMRYTTKGDAIVLPQGRYHKIDSAI